MSLLQLCWEKDKVQTTTWEQRGVGMALHREKIIISRVGKIFKQSCCGIFSFDGIVKITADDGRDTPACMFTFEFSF